MNEIIKAEIKKLTKKMDATTEMESHNYYRGKIAGLKLAIRLEPPVSLRLRHKYSGDDSKLFWKLVNAMGERQQEFYSLGVVLQNLESWILTQMKYEAPNFVEDEQASN